MHRLPLLLLCTLAPLGAQTSSPILLVERAADRAGRDLLRKRLAARRVDVHFDAISARDLARFLAAATGDETNFIVSSRTTKAEDLPRISLDVRQINLLSLMGLVEDASDLRFVFRDGLVLIQPKGEVKELTSLRIYDVRMATMKIRSFVAPKLGLTLPGEEPKTADENDQPETTLSGFTLENLVELIRNNVAKDSWDKEGISLTTLNGMLAIRQTDAVHREVEKLLRQLGVGVASWPFEPERKEAKKGKSAAQAAGEAAGAKRTG